MMWWYWIIADALKSATPLFIGLFAAWIARNQWKTARDKVRLDTFDRRFEVYIRLAKLMERARISKSLNQEEIVELNRNIELARFLYGGEFAKHLETVREKAIKLVVEHEAFGNPAFSSDEAWRERAKVEILDLIHWLKSQREQFPELVKPYLSFEHIREM